MSTNRPARTIRCAYCGTETSVPSRRGPAPIYCSPAHRQAAYRERHHTEPTGPQRSPQRSVRDELDALRDVLEDASAATSWTMARRILNGALAPRATGEGSSP